VNKNSCRVLVEKPVGRRLLGAFMHRKENNIQMCLREKGLNVIELVHLAQNRDKW
jgi:hypothetical protein